MPDTRSPENGVAAKGGRADDDPGATSGSLIRRRPGLRIGLVSLAAVTVLLGAVVAGGYAYVNHAVGLIRRIPVGFLTRDNPAGGLNILLTSNDIGATYASGEARASGPAGLVMLLHIDASGEQGGEVTIPPDVVVDVPGHGRTQLRNATALGGPSLLAETVSLLTGLPVNHYARIDFAHVASLIDAVGGVDVTVPETTKSLGHAFTQGVNHIDGAEALDYAREPSLTEEERALRQGNLVHAVLDKLAAAHLLTSPMTMVGVLSALTTMLTVDSDFSNADIENLAARLASLGSSAVTFVTAPTMRLKGSMVLSPGVSDQLWNAVSHDTLAAFAREFPSAVTPIAPYPADSGWLVGPPARGLTAVA